MKTLAWIGIILLSVIGLWMVASALLLPRLSAEQAAVLAQRTLRQIKRAIILVVGITVVIVGIIMLVAPGPGLVVIPIGLAVLATEFVWARRLLRQYKTYAQQLRDQAEANTVTKPRPALAIIVVVTTLACIAAAVFLREWPLKPILMVGGGALGLETLWVLLMISRYRKRIRTATADRSNAATTPQLTDSAHRSGPTLDVGQGSGPAEPDADGERPPASH